MALYLISYDIAEKDRDEYQELWDHLDSLGAVRILYSEFAVPFSGRAIDLANEINAHLRSTDRLLVCELFSSASAWVNLRISTADFQQLLADYARTLE